MIAAMIRILSLVLLSPVLLSAQSIPNRPTLESQPAGQVYKGPSAEPKLNSDQWTFRTRIRRGAKSPVQFAGHYTVPQFGCGTECSVFYIVDSVTGRVYDGFGVADLPIQWLEKHSEKPQDRIQFTPSSRLLRINGCPNEKDCGYYDYVMVDGEGLKLLQKWLLPKEFQY